MAILKGDDRRRFVPLALVQTLTALIDAESLDPSVLRAELRTIRSRLVLLYKLDDPQAPARDTDVSQLNAEEDGQEILDSP